MLQATVIKTQQADHEWEEWGEELVERLAQQDFEALVAGFHPQVRCRLLIPAGLMTPVGPEALVGKLRQWFGDADLIQVESRQVSMVGDRLHVGYRMRVREGVWYQVEQQTYSLLEEGSIVQFDLLCSGFRPEVGAS